MLDADGDGDPYVVALAVNDAIDEGADVINLSFGIASKPKSTYLKEAIKRAKKANVTIVAAAGNTGTKDDSHYPAREKDVIGVAASTRGNDAIAQLLQLRETRPRGGTGHRRRQHPARRWVRGMERNLHGRSDRFRSGGAGSQ